MKYINKLASVFFMAALALLTMTSCEGGDLYNVGAPDWLAEMSAGEEDDSNIISVTPNPSMLGSSDNTTAWWTVFTDDYKTESGKTYQIKFMNYGGASNWNNFVLILRNEAKDFEYAVLRADNWGWGTGYTGEESDAHFAKKMESDSRDWGAWAKAMNMAKCTMNLYNNGDGTADVKITMIGSDGNTYTQEYMGISVDKDNLYFAFTVDNSHIEFGDIDVEDSEPTALVLSGVPATVNLGTDLEEAMKNVTGVVTFTNSEGAAVNKDVKATDLIFQAIPDYETAGNKTLIVMYNKTLLGNLATKPVIASANFTVVDEIASIEVTKAPATYYFYSSSATSSMTDRKLIVNVANIEVTAKYANGRTRIVEPNALKYSLESVPATAGTYNLTITTENGKTATTTVKVETSTATVVHPTPTNLGASDNSQSWVATDQISIEVGATIQADFTNYSGAANWNNYLVELHDGTTPITLRADNWGWSNETDDVRWNACIKSGGQTDWTTWLGAMNGADCTAYITNCGNGCADVQVIMHGTNGITYYQYYLSIPFNSANGLKANFNIDGCHLVFK